MVALGGTMAKNITATAEYGDKIDKASQKMGVSAEAYQEWDFVMQHCGTSMDSMKASMKTLATAAEKGNDAFSKLGISQKDIANMSQEELFDATIKGLQGVTDTTERTYLAGQLLGRGATELGGVLNMSAEEVEAMKQQLHDMGGVMSNQAVKNAAQFEDSLQNVKTAIGGAKNTILSDFLPACSAAMDGVTLIFSGDIEGGIKKIESGIKGFINNLTNALPKITKVGGSIATSLISVISKNMPAIMKCGTELITQLLTGIVQALPDLVNGIVSLATSIIEALPRMVEVIVATLPSLIPIIITGLVTMIVTLCSNFEQIIAPIIQNLPLIITSIVDALITNLPILLNGVIQLVLGIVNSVDQIITTLVPMIPTIIIQIVVALVKEIPTILAAIVKITVAVAKCIADWFGSWFKGFGNALKSIVTKIGDILKDILGKVKEKFEAIKTAISEKVEAIKEKVREKFEAIKTAISEKVENAKTAVKEKFEAIKSAISEKVQAVHDKVKSIFDKVKSAITTPVETAKNKVKTIIDAIKGFFNFKWSLPKLKVPHFSISPSGWKIGDLLKGSIPHLSVSWNARGGVFDEPTLFTGNGGLQGLGENGAEAVVPLEKNTKWLDKIAEKLTSHTNNKPIYLVVNGKVWAETTIDTLNDYTKQTGNLPIKVM